MENQVQILDKVVYISLIADTLEKDMYTIIFPPAMAYWAL